MLSHFDAVVYYTGDDLLPQDVGEGVTDANYRRGGTQNDQTATSRATGSAAPATGGVRNAQMLRNYMNEGGKVVFEGRNGWVQQTSTSTALNTYSGYTWWQEPVYGFVYPPNQAGDDDRPHTAFFRELDISNDLGQWFLGVAGRQGGPARRRTTRAPRSTGAGRHARRACRRSRSTPRRARASTLDPTQDPMTGASRAAPRSRRRGCGRSRASRRSGAFRQERVEADYAGRTTANGGAVISTRDSVSLGFGLEQIADAAPRAELVRRMMAPPAADDGGHHRADRRRGCGPAAGATVTPGDPVEIEVEAVDERGDIKEVRLQRRAGSSVQRKVSFPFQMRW